MTARHPEARPADRPATARAPRSRLVRLLVLTVVLTPQASALLVQSFAPTLLREAPLVLLALHPFEPWSWLVSAAVDPVPFVVVMMSVRVVPYSAAYLLGRWYGEQGLAVLRGSGRAGRVTGVVQRLFGRVGGVVLALYPGSVVSALAGATGMRPRHFAPLVLTGLLVSTGLALVLGQVAEGPLLAVTRFIERSTTWLTVALAAATVVLVARAWLARRRPGTQGSAKPPEHSAGTERPAGPSATTALGTGDSHT